MKQDDAAANIRQGHPLEYLQLVTLEQEPDIPERLKSTVAARPTFVFEQQSAR
jgi:hypothetical protein